MTQQPKILIVDDKPENLFALEKTLQKLDAQVYQAKSGNEALGLTIEHDFCMAIVDVQMPEMDGVDALKQLRVEFPALPVLILTTFSDDAHVYAALRAGASGFLLKEMNGDDLVSAIRGAAQGKPQLHPDIARRLMARAPMPDDPFESLTERERGILKLIAKSMSNKEIASQLFLTEMTVKGYVSDLFAKLGVNDRTQAALMAIRFGLVKPEEL